MDNRKMKNAIRRYMALLTDLETAMQSSTTLGKLKEIARKHSVNEDVITTLIFGGVVRMTPADPTRVFFWFDNLDNESFLFNFVHKVDYVLADLLRLVMEFIRSNEDYLSNGKNKEIIAEMEIEDLAPSRRCQHCGYPLVGKSERAKYCSDSCKSMAYQDRKALRPFIEKKPEAKTNWFRRWWKKWFGK